MSDDSLMGLGCHANRFGGLQPGIWNYLRAVQLSPLFFFFFLVSNCFELWVLRVWLQCQLAWPALHTPRTETTTMECWTNHPSQRPSWLRTKESAGNETMSWKTVPWSSAWYPPPFAPASQIPSFSPLWRIPWAPKLAETFSSTWRLDCVPRFENNDQFASS